MLDAKLKAAGFSEKNLADAKEKVQNILEKFKIFAEGRKNVYSDFAKASHSAEDSLSTVNGAAKDFEKTEELITELKDAVSEYENASPAFITEFLSPEGIMTKKRELDKKAQENISQAEALNVQIEELRNANSELAQKIDEYKETCSKLRVNKAQMETQIQAAMQQASLLRRNLVSEQNSLRQANEELESETKPKKPTHLRFARKKLPHISLI